MADSSSTSAQVPAAGESPPAPTSRIVGHFRWVICTLLLIGVTQNYLDRLIIGLLKTTLQQDLGWSEIDYGNLVFAFSAAYAVGMVMVGRFIDWIGTRLGYAFAMAAWSLACMCHGLASSFGSFLVARSALGFSEAGVFPASLKAIAEWFPQKERALATGIFNAGTNLGAIVAPLLVPWITFHWGWRWTFLSLGSLGFGWLVIWLWMYGSPKEHPRCSVAELDYIQRNPREPQAAIAWIDLLRYRQAWAFLLGKFITDPVWWFYLFWIPDFLQREHRLRLFELGAPLVLIYVLADAGSVAGGGISSLLIRRGKTVNAGRKMAMLICAVSVVPIVLVPRVASTWGAVLLLGLATAAHQGFSANLFTLPSDMFAKRAVASVVGIGGMAGAVGGMLIAKVVSYLLQWTGSYTIPFVIAGSAYLLALGIIQALVPTLAPAPVVAGET
ncbi:MAG TPA: MFS transporter [Terriglobales bacterium]|nr:MFS transporter [Terriglobales bacterium]